MAKRAVQAGPRIPLHQCPSRAIFKLLPIQYGSGRRPTLAVTTCKPDQCFYLISHRQYQVINHLKCGSYVNVQSLLIRLVASVCEGSISVLTLFKSCFSSSDLVSAADSNFSVMIFHILQQSSLELDKCIHLELYRNGRAQLVSVCKCSEFILEG